jgi:small subunit ribosomal protein S6
MYSSRALNSFLPGWSWLYWHSIYRQLRILRERSNVSFYENVFIARQDVSSTQVDGLVETFEKIITDMGGSVPKKELWGLRTMAYKIKKNRKGHYVLMNIDAPSEAVHELERQMNLNEDVLRYLTTRVDELEEGPTAIMRTKERGDERERRDGQDDNLGYNKNSNISPDSSTKEIKVQEDEKNELEIEDAEPTDKSEKLADSSIDEAPAVDNTKEVEVEGEDK